ncbi:MAG: universal stress protein [Myxococcota bacterium]
MTGKPYANIVVGTDFSPTAWEALRSGLALARSLGSTLHLVHVDPKLKPTLPLSPDNRRTVQELQRRQRRESRERLAGLVPKSATPPVRTRLLVGSDPSAALLKYVERSGADLLVLGRRGRSPLGEMLIGSTADRCLRRARIAVLLIPALDRR